MDTPHALFQADGIPWDVVVDHQPAKLQVDTLPSGLGCHEDLAFFPKLALCVDSGARRVPVANRHASMNLGHRKTPLAKLAERPPVPAIAGEVVECVLVLGEDEELHPPVLEDVLLI